MQLTAEQTSLEPLPYRGEQGGPRAVHERARLVNARESQIPELPQSIETTCRIEMSPAGRPVVSLRAPDPPVSGVDAPPAGIGSDLLRQDDAATSSDPRAWSVGMRGKALGRS